MLKFRNYLNYVLTFAFFPDYSSIFLPFKKIKILFNVFYPHVCLHTMYVTIVHGG